MQNLPQLYEAAPQQYSKQKFGQLVWSELEVSESLQKHINM